MISRLFLLCVLVATTAVAAWTVVHHYAPTPISPNPKEGSRTWPVTVPLIPPPHPAGAV